MNLSLLNWITNPISKAAFRTTSRFLNDAGKHFNIVSKMKAHQQPNSRGRVLIVGAGPGDPGLLTLHAMNAIQRADVVLIDQLVSDAIIELIPSSVTQRFVGKRAGCHSMTQADIGQLMLEYALEGRQVVRLKGGDPSIFARTAEEAQVLESHSIDFSIVPGITAASAAAASQGFPLTLRGKAQSVRIITARQQDALSGPDWQNLATSLKSETLVFYMGTRRLNHILQSLINAGMPQQMPSAVIENASLPSEQMFLENALSLLEKAELQQLNGPCLIIVGHALSTRYGVTSISRQLREFGMHHEPS